MTKPTPNIRSKIVTERDFTKFKTVDDLINSYLTQKFKNSYSDYTVCDFVIINVSYTLLEILKLNTNIPSRFDLILIKCISNRMSNSPMNSYVKILEIYNNRK